MSIAYITTSDAIPNKILQKLVSEMIDIGKIAMVQGFNARANPRVYTYKPSKILAGGKKRKSIPSLGLVAAEIYDSLSPDRLKTLKGSLGDSHDITADIRKRAIDMRSATAVLEQVKSESFHFINALTFSVESVQNMIEDLFGPLVHSSGTSENAVLNKALNCRVHEVKCIDETNPEWAGNDEIAWGGIAIENGGGVTTIPEAKLGGGFHDGYKKKYNPPHVLQSFQIVGRLYPKTYTILLALAEKDSGGFSEFIRKLWEAVNAEIYAVLTSLGAAAGAWVGAQIGGSLGTSVAGPLGTIIGAVAGAVVGALVGWLVACLKDDIFEPQGTSTYLISSESTFTGGSLTSTPQTLTYRGHGGQYSVTIDWEIVR